jgi:hypothetical protein
LLPVLGSNELAKAPEKRSRFVVLTATDSQSEAFNDLSNSFSPKVGEEGKKKDRPVAIVSGKRGRVLTREFLKTARCFAGRVSHTGCDSRRLAAPIVRVVLDQAVCLPDRYPEAE